MTTAKRLLFTAPHTVEIDDVTLPPVGAEQVRVRTLFSAISAGTERLLYCGHIPPDMPLDETIGALAGKANYPVSYGYAAVGQIAERGRLVDNLGINQLVFAFYPHTSQFVVDKSAVLPLPAGLDPAEALFLPNMETAVSFGMDAQPVLGEQVAIFGLGVIGLLTTAVLSRFPLTQLIGVDGLAKRRKQAQNWGATAVYAPPALAQAQLDVDLSLELSGNPAALNTALAITGNHGRILIGSWYGQKNAPLHLGGSFHRAHQTLIASQVSQLKPKWHGRWNKARRLAVAWQLLAEIKPSTLITHRYPIRQAPAVYQQLAHNNEEMLQVIFTYD